MTGKPVEFGILGTERFIGVGRVGRGKRLVLYETKPGMITVLAIFHGDEEAEAARSMLEALAFASSGVVVEDPEGNKTFRPPPSVRGMMHK